MATAHLSHHFVIAAGGAHTAKLIRSDCHANACSANQNAALRLLRGDAITDNFGKVGIVDALFPLGTTVVDGSCYGRIVVAFVTEL